MKDVVEPSAAAANEQAQALEAAAARAPLVDDAVRGWLAAAEIRKERLGDLDGALADLRRAAQLAPTQRLVLNRYAQACAHAGRWSELVDVLELSARAARNDDERARVLAHRGDVLGKKLGRLAEARSIYREVARLARDPALGSAAREAVERIDGLLTPQRGGAPRERTFVGRVRGLSTVEPPLSISERPPPDDRVDQVNRAARAAMEGGRRVDARALVEQSLALRPWNEAAIRLRRELLRVERRWEDLVRLLAAEAAEAPTPAMAGAALGEAAEVSADLLRDVPGALALVRRALVYPGQEEVSMARAARLAVRHGAYDAARALRPELSPAARAEWLAQLAGAATATGDAEAALALRAIAFEDAVTDVSFFQARVQVLERAGDAAGVEAALLRRLLEVTDPDERRAMAWELSASCESQGRWRDAVQPLLELVVHASHDQEVTEVLASVERLAVLASDRALYVRALETAARRARGHVSRWWVALARVLRDELLDAEGAASALSRARALGADVAGEIAALGVRLDATRIPAPGAEADETTEADGPPLVMGVVEPVVDDVPEPTDEHAMPRLRAKGPQDTDDERPVSRGAWFGPRDSAAPPADDEVTAEREVGTLRAELSGATAAEPRAMTTGLLGAAAIEEPIEELSALSRVAGSAVAALSWASEVEVTGRSEHEPDDGRATLPPEPRERAASVEGLPEVEAVLLEDDSAGGIPMGEVASPGAGEVPDVVDGAATSAADRAASSLRSLEGDASTKPPATGGFDVARAETREAPHVDGVGPEASARASSGRADDRGAHLAASPVAGAVADGAAEVARAAADGLAADAPGARPQEARVEGARVDGARPQDARVEGARVEGARVEGARVEGARVEGARVEGARVGEGARVEGARVEGARVEGARVEGARVEGARVDDARPQEARVEGAWVDDARPQDARVESARVGDARPAGAWVDDARPQEARVEGAWVDDARPQDARVERARVGDARVGDARPAGARVDDARPQDARVEGAWVDDARPQDARVEGARVGDARVGDARVGDARVGDARVGDARVGDARPAGARVDDARPQDARPQDARVDDARPQDARPQDARPQDARPQDAQVDDARPQDARADDARPQDARADDARPQAARVDGARPQAARVDGAWPEDGRVEAAGVDGAWSEAAWPEDERVDGAQVEDAPVEGARAVDQARALAGLAVAVPEAPAALEPDVRELASVALSPDGDADARDVDAATSDAPEVAASVDRGAPEGDAVDGPAAVDAAERRGEVARHVAPAEAVASDAPEVAVSAERGAETAAADGPAASDGPAGSVAAALDAAMALPQLSKAPDGAAAEAPAGSGAVRRGRAPADVVDGPAGADAPVGVVAPDALDGPAGPAPPEDERAAMAAASARAEAGMGAAGGRVAADAAGEPGALEVARQVTPDVTGPAAADGADAAVGAVAARDGAAQAARDVEREPAEVRAAEVAVGVVAALSRAADGPDGIAAREVADEPDATAREVADRAAAVDAREAADALAVAAPEGPAAALDATHSRVEPAPDGPAAALDATHSRGEPAPDGGVEAARDMTGEAARGAGPEPWLGAAEPEPPEGRGGPGEAGGPPRAAGHAVDSPARPTEPPETDAISADGVVPAPEEWMDARSSSGAAAWGAGGEGGAIPVEPVEATTDVGRVLGVDEVTHAQARAPFADEAEDAPPVPEVVAARGDEAIPAVLARRVEPMADAFIAGEPVAAARWVAAGCHAVEVGCLEVARSCFAVGLDEARAEGSERAAVALVDAAWSALEPADRDVTRATWSPRPAVPELSPWARVARRARELEGYRGRALAARAGHIAAILAPADPHPVERAWLEAAAEAHPHAAAAIEALYERASARGDVDAARHWIRRAIEAREPPTRWWLRAAELEAQARLSPRAAAALAEALDASPLDIEPARRLAELGVEVGERTWLERGLAELLERYLWTRAIGPATFVALVRAAHGVAGAGDQLLIAVARELRARAVPLDPALPEERRRLEAAFSTGDVEVLRRMLDLGSPDGRRRLLLVLSPPFLLADLP